MRFRESSLVSVVFGPQTVRLAVIAAVTCRLLDLCVLLGVTLVLRGEDPGG